MADNIFTLVKQEKEESKGYIELTWESGRIDVIQADSFGAYEPLPGMIMIWKDNPEEIIGFFNSNFIISIRILNDYEEV